MEKTQLIAEPEKTKMVAPEKTVKIKILREINDPRSKEVPSPILRPGDLLELPVSMAKQILSRKVRGMYDFSGERSSHETVAMIKYAEIYHAPVEELEQA